MANKRTLDTGQILFMVNASISVMLQVKAVPQAVNIRQDLMTIASSKLLAMFNAAGQTPHVFCYFRHFAPD